MKKFIYRNNDFSIREESNGEKTAWFLYYKNEKLPCQKELRLEIEQNFTDPPIAEITVKFLWLK